jgi:hypothetical protein
VDPLDPANFVSTLSGLTAGTYIYTLTGNVTLTSGITLDTPGVDLTLNGGGYTITQDANITLFTVKDGATLTLQNSKLQGGAGRTGRGVSVTFGGTFIMQDGVEIRGFTYGYGAGVASSGTFRMEGGVIAGNTATANSDGGGGVDILHYSGGSVFEKTGGIIYGSDGGVNANTAAAGDGWGHAVLVYDTDEIYPYRDTTVEENLSITLDGSGNIDPASVEGTWTGYNP